MGKAYHEIRISEALRMLSENGRVSSEREYAYFKLSEALEKAFEEGWILTGVSDDIQAQLKKKDSTVEYKDLSKHYREITGSLIDFRCASTPEKRKTTCKELSSALSSAVADGYALERIFIDDWGFESSLLKEI